MNLAMLAFRSASLPRVSRKFLQRLNGSFIHPFQHRRELNAVSHRWHKFVDTLDESCSLGWPPDIRDEVVAAGLLLPLAYQNLRWGVSPIVTASDATPVSSALLTSVIGVDLAE